MAKSYLILGANSLIAGYLKRTFTGDIFSLNRQELDIQDVNLFSRYVKDHNIDTVINCAGSSKSHKNNYLELYKLNAFYPGALAQICREQGIRFVFISTGRVFDGSKENPYVESDGVNPLDDYGLSKYLGERLVENALYDGRYLIFRIPLTYGIKKVKASEQLLSRFLQKAKEGKEILVSDDAFNSPSYAFDIAEMMANYLRDDLSNGCYHLYNEGQVTIAQLAEEFFSLLKIPARLKKVSRENFGTFYRQAGNLALLSEKLPSACYWDKALGSFVEELLESKVEQYIN